MIAKQKKYSLYFHLFSILLLYSCAAISVFDHYAYTQSTAIKAESLLLMDKATDDFSNHEKEVNDLILKVEKIYEYEKGRPKNEITTRMWENLKSGDKNLLGGFLKRWRTDKKLGKAFIEEAKKIISEAFDQVIGLESRKIKKSQITGLN